MYSFWAYGEKIRHNVHCIHYDKLYINIFIREPGVWASVGLFGNTTRFWDGRHWVTGFRTESLHLAANGWFVVQMCWRTRVRNKKKSVPSPVGPDRRQNGVMRERWKSIYLQLFWSWTFSYLPFVGLNNKRPWRAGLQPVADSGFKGAGICIYICI